MCYRFAGQVYLQTKTGENKERFIVVTKVQGEDDMKKLEENKLAQDLVRSLSI